MVASGLQRTLHRARATVASPSRRTRSAVVLGRLLGLAFVVCFLSGMYSHFLQQPLPWMVFPTKPVWLYQVSQGVHVTAGIACFPLLLGKLHAVFPELFQSPPVRSPLHLLERASIALFVAASLVEITIGLLNTYQLYAWFPFSFRRLHFVLSFVIIGSLALHIAVKLPIIARYWRRDGSDPAEPRPSDPVGPDAPGTAVRPGGVTGRLSHWVDREPQPLEGASDDRSAALGRRGFFATIAVATGALILFTAGQSFSILRPLAFFAPRLPGTGPQGLPVNHTAASAGVVEAASADDWSLEVRYGERSATFSRAELEALPQVEETIPLACVEGWSQSARWRGVRMRDLLTHVDAPADATIRVRSLQQRSQYTVMIMPSEFVLDDATLVALELDGQVLDLDHGYPARIICSSRPGVLQTKWLSSIEVIA
ncbi:Oxidoreductase molybdopterin binding domain-containing protein [Plantibacter flavus]|uniref:Molybdopterin-dependent oxidoreductase-like protein n=1 Tax=Plantibacter flavus TaxID=150123 RepID=A0A3N2BXY9_9MICO|nr:molybdopterin-dependent oxidoreductase [Plantibacter flavus]ROR80107.1 molybdopterin-dependent oxidoreductase-like protein [Plantibacter flavus]SMG29379.1 Oxidoreductase molybdopterin binding domain-containing protein [Plantibacter flavus]